MPKYMDTFSSQSSVFYIVKVVVWPFVYELLFVYIYEHVHIHLRNIAFVDHYSTTLKPVLNDNICDGVYSDTM